MTDLPPFLGAAARLLPPELQAPPFLRELKERGDILERLYWLGAIGELRAAIADEDPDRVRRCLRKLFEDGHAREVEEILEHRDRVRAFFSRAAAPTIGIIVVPDGRRR